MESKTNEREREADCCDGRPCRKGERDDEDDDDDKVTLVGSLHLAGNDERKSEHQTLYLDTRLARQSVVQESRGAATTYPAQLAPVTIVFDLPDGSQAEQKFQLGQTVEFLKSFVESEFGIAMACQDLYLGSKLMMDPLSLLDYPEADGLGNVLITVEGEMSAGAKK